jgi:putative transposase
MSKPVSYKRHRFPPEIIAHAVWLYFRFPLSLRLVEEMLLERGIVVSYETLRRWALKFEPAYARRLKRKTPSRRDIWHLDEIVVATAGQKQWLWRAVDQDGYVLDGIIQSRHQIMPAVEHRSHKGLNNRAENSHLPLRRRERAMQGFRSPGGLQRFTSVFSAVRNLFVPPRSRRSALVTHLHHLAAMASPSVTALASLRSISVNVTTPSSARQRRLSPTGARRDASAAPSPSGTSAVRHGRRASRPKSGRTCVGPMVS